jgi:hypothetical protein
VYAVRLDTIAAMRGCRSGGAVLVALATLAAVFLAAAPPARAWGSDGHRAIGAIASHYLTPRARRAVDRLLEPGPWGTLSSAGYWADGHARHFRAYDAYLRRHFVNVEPTAERVVMARDCREDCILTAIEALTGALYADQPPLWERAQDFRFLVHFVEDLHQPLHVAHPDGRGGNLTAVTLFGEETNLHSVWDQGLIEHRLADWGEADDERPGSAPRWEEWAFTLRAEITPEEVRDWSAPLDPLVWAGESLAAARRHTYDVATGAALGEAYYGTTIPVVEARIRMAAVRLAALLNDIFDPARDAPAD